MMLAPVRTVAPAETPISLAQAKAQLRIEADNTDDDPLIAALIDAATSHLDGYSGILGRCLVTQTWSQSTWPFPSGAFRLPLTPVQSIVSIKYWDAANIEQTVTGAGYERVTDAVGTYVSFVSGFSGPQTYRRNDAATVTYVCGYGTAAEVPAAIKQAMLLMIGAWYSNREEVGEGTAGLLPLGAKALLAPFRRVGL